MHKFRYSLLIFLFVSLFCVKKTLGSQKNVPQNQTNFSNYQDSSSPGWVTEGFSDEREAFDSLVYWVTHPKVKPSYGFLSEELFFKQLRLIDTITPKSMAKAQHIHYQHKMKKSISKFMKYCKSNKLILKKIDSASGLPVLVKWPPIVYRYKGPFAIKRYEIELTKKKLKFILQFELWWIEGKGYWSNELRFYDNAD